MTGQEFLEALAVRVAPVRIVSVAGDADGIAVHLADGSKVSVKRRDVRAASDMSHKAIAAALAGRNDG